MNNKLINLRHFCYNMNLSREKNTYFVRKLKGLLVYCIGGGYNLIVSFLYNSYFPYTTKVGVGLKLSHSFNGIHISRSCQIGDYCTILQNTTIGSNQPVNDKAPKIGNNVFIGANCTIIGDVVIGDDCIIGAGTVIAKGIIPKGSIVVGSKYRIINEV
ncbi:DapH/DapD/GlmU-related protein [Vibrio sp. Isolate30]|uniref:DapH/DapD/GlmU-related protein n=1 Tax=Vibrio sp. Isolate30 TaxID=2908536 RepID=UPI001EFCCAE5|nr:DapH/DapD/GlmU-related protein [Vibrio sp. Isolate30]MCG9632637.1 hypothetical protein [Vibrio sp. Isolate30]